MISLHYINNAPSSFLCPPFSYKAYPQKWQAIPQKAKGTNERLSLPTIYIGWCHNHELSSPHPVHRPSPSLSLLNRVWSEQSSDAPHAKLYDWQAERHTRILLSPSSSHF